MRRLFFAGRSVGELLLLSILSILSSLVSSFSVGSVDFCWNTGHEGLAGDWCDGWVSICLPITRDTSSVLVGFTSLIIRILPTFSVNLDYSWSPVRRHCL